MKKLMLIVVLLATRLLGANADVDPNFYIYICFGQSNMEGNAQPESIDKTGIDERFRLLATCSFSSPSRTKGQWYKATPPLVSPNGGLGPSDYFGRTMVECLPENVRVGVIPVAMGGSPIEMFDKDKYLQKMKDNPSEWWVTLAKNHYGGNPYGRIIEMAKKAQEVGVIKGILLHQGCSNNGDSNWPNMVKKIYNDMLTDLNLGADSVPLFVGETLYENQGGSCYAHNTQVDRMPSVVPTSYVVSSDGCPGNGIDPWHFNAWGYRILGSRYAAEALYALGVQYPFFLFHNYTFVPSKNASFNATTRTITYKDAGLTTWTYPHFADWSGYKYLVVKLKEQQTIDAEVWLYGANKNVSYRDAIGDRTTVVIDLHNLKMNNKVMDPSQVYKMAFRSPNAGKIVIDDVFLSNDSEYEPKVKYALNENDTFTSGQTVEVEKDVVSITFGEAGGADFKAAKADSKVEGYTAFTEGNGTNGMNAGGTFYTIKPEKDGFIEVAVVINAGKAFYIIEDGTALADYNGIIKAEKYYGKFSFAAKANRSYKVYCANSKLGFYGFELKENSTTTEYHTLSITASGNGSATFNDNAVRGKTQTFTVSGGTSAIVNFAPDDGYRIASVKLNNIDITANVSNNQYTISNIVTNTTIEVTFEAISHLTSLRDVPFYSWDGWDANAKPTGVAGCAWVIGESTNMPYGDANIINYADLSAYDRLRVTVTEGTPRFLFNRDMDDGGWNENEKESHLIDNTKGGWSAKYFTSEEKDGITTWTVDLALMVEEKGYAHLHSIKGANWQTVTVINMVLESEVKTTYTLNITASGNGSATYNNTAIRGKTQAFTVSEGTTATVTFAPDAGYRIASVKLNNADVTASVANNKYTISNIKKDTNVEVSFEEIPPTTDEINPNPTEIVVHGKERDDLEDDYAINENEGGTGHPWDNELWIVANRTLSAGEKTIVQFKYKSSIPAHTTTQCHAQPGKYLHYEAIGDIEFSEQWQNFETTFVVPAYADGMQSIDILMAHIKEACDYYIKDVVWKLADNTESLINEEGVDNFYVSEGADNEPHVYDPNGYSPPKTYTLSITSSGNGYVAYDGNTIRSKTSSFDVVEGTNAVLKFSADDGNRLKSVKVNGQDVTASVVGNQYTISNISANATITVVFEPIPTYSLNIAASGNGSVSYDRVTIRNQSQNFTLREGSSAVLSFNADNGYRIASVKVNAEDMTSQIVDGKIYISNITQDTSVEVVFGEIPSTTYSLNITAIGNGSVTYDGNTVRGGTSTFTVVEGSFAIVQISADEGYRLKQAVLDGKDVTADIADGQYTTTKIMANMTLAVEFEAIPTYTLTIKSSAFGSVKYGDAVITDQTQTFTVREGTSATIAFTSGDNGRLQSIMLNGNDITNQLVNGQFTITDIRADQSIEAEFVEDITKVTDAGVAYTVTSYDEQTVIVAAGNYGNVLTVPASFTAKDKTWTVTGMAEDALSSANELAAIIWDPEVAFTAEVGNPNLLLYVKKAEYAPSTIQNVVVNNQAENIVLVEATEGNDFYCPIAFKAKYISYEHNYSMISGYKTCQGWETLVLPFDVSMMISTKGQELTPYTTWQYGNSQRPFWLYEMTAQGWKAGSGIKANTPYIISMPNNEMYDVSFNITGNIQFIGNNVEVKPSNQVITGQHGNKRLVCNYQMQEANNRIYVLNVSNEWCQNTATEKEGSTFIRSLRSVHPFEAYMTVEGSNAPMAIPVFDNDVLTNIVEMERMRNGENEDWYDLQGRKLQGEPKKNGIYLHNGKKVRK